MPIKVLSLYIILCVMGTPTVRRNLINAKVTHFGSHMPKGIYIIEPVGRV